MASLCSRNQTRLVPNSNGDVEMAQTSFRPKESKISLNLLIGKNHLVRWKTYLRCLMGKNGKRRNFCRSSSISVSCFISLRMLFVSANDTKRFMPRNISCCLLLHVDTIYCMHAKSSRRTSKKRSQSDD